MKIHLEELEHQKNAINAILNSFTGIDFAAPEYENPNYVYGNPLIRYRYQEKANIDIKMETGTGKTYVGTRMMYELNKQFGLTKFIIVVPSPAIKEGWKNFLTAGYTQQHFAQFYENVGLDVSIINAGDFKSKSGRKNMPAHLMSFVEGSRQNANTINVLLINDAMLRSKSMRDEYDQTLLSGFTKPIESIQATRPVVIMDEPHRFPREFKDGKWIGKSNYKAVESLKAQMIVRLGATFNLNKKGNQRDYYHSVPQYSLNAVESFNKNLVKAVDVYYPLISEEEAKNTYKVKSINSRELVLSQGQTVYAPLKNGDDLSLIDSGFEGNVTYIGGKKLSNDLELEPGMTLIPGTFTQSYQELIIRNAIDKHFEKERENFFRPNGKIKTVSLFFIDSISSYGVKSEDGEGRKLGWLAQIFDRLLLEKLNQELSLEGTGSIKEQEYFEFLRATKVNIGAARGAYFGEDRSSNDEGIQQEVNDILSNKEKQLSFKDSNGNWNTRRFLFSKWTLREGWDNPNVFVIAKLRTSGSENSKIQEVGRGLRLPVDEFGHRISDEEFRLAFLIGYDEKNFAKQLMDDINKDVFVQFNENKLTRETIDVILKHNPELNEEKLLVKLDDLQIIKRNNDFKEEGFLRLKELFPELINGLYPNKVTTNNENPKKMIKLKKENWKELKTLWEELSKRHMVVFDRIPNKEWEILLKDMLLQSGKEIFQLHLTEQVHQKIDISDEARVQDTTSTIEIKNTMGKMSYGKFLEALARRTRIPIQLLLKILTNYLQKEFDPGRDNKVTEYLNERSLTNFAHEFNNVFEEKFKEFVKFDALNFEAKTSVWNTDTNSFVNEIPSGNIGKFENYDETSNKERALYKEPPVFFDSKNPELELLSYGYDKTITTFGKIPKKAIQIPKYTGGTTTPDFVYKIGSDLYLLVEAKSPDMRKSEKSAVNIQEKFLNQFENIHYRVAHSAQDVLTELKKIKARFD